MFPDLASTLDPLAIAIHHKTNRFATRHRRTCSSQIVKELFQLSVYSCQLSELTTHYRALRTNCGAEGIRTLDPLVANQVLSQLSYSPVAGN